MHDCNNGSPVPTQVNVTCPAAHAQPAHTDQVLPIEEILSRAPVFPADIWDIDDPEAFLLCEVGWGM